MFLALFYSFFLKLLTLLIAELKKRLGED